MSLPHPRGSASAVAIAWLAMALVAIFAVVFAARPFIEDSGGHGVQDVRSTDASPGQVGDKLHAVRIRSGPVTPRVDLGIVDAAGNPTTVACSTCHAQRQPNLETRTSADLNEFHTSVQLAHGSITCLSCHNSGNYDQLKLADGTAVEFPNVMQLCAQCHGPQMRDFEHGAHGGMTGYWDLSRGPRVRNNCVDCHQPHLPKFPAMQPSFKPYDRFLSDRPAKDRGHE